LDETFSSSKTSHVVERVKAHAPLEICWRPPGEARSPVKNHCDRVRQR